jgi:acyl carrier protein
VIRSQEEFSAAEETTMRTAEEIRKELKALIADQQKCDLTEIPDSARLSELRLDSLDIIYLMMNAEDRFATRICEKEFRNLRTLDEVIALLQRLESENVMSVVTT